MSDAHRDREERESLRGGYSRHAADVARAMEHPGLQSALANVARVAEMPGLQRAVADAVRVMEIPSLQSRMADVARAMEHPGLQSALADAARVMETPNLQSAMADAATAILSAQNPSVRDFAGVSQESSEVSGDSAHGEAVSLSAETISEIEEALAGFEAVASDLPPAMARRLLIAWIQAVAFTLCMYVLVQSPVSAELVAYMGTGAVAAAKKAGDYAAYVWDRTHPQTDEEDDPSSD